MLHLSFRENLQPTRKLPQKNLAVLKGKFAKGEMNINLSYTLFVVLYNTAEAFSCKNRGFKIGAKNLVRHGVQHSIKFPTQAFCCDCNLYIF